SPGRTKWRSRRGLRRRWRRRRPPARARSAGASPAAARFQKFDSCSWLSFLFWRFCPDCTESGAVAQMVQPRGVAGQDRLLLLGRDALEVAVDRVPGVGPDRAGVRVVARPED